MDATVTSFGDRLTRSGVLEPHTDLQVQLRDVQTTSRALVEEVGISTNGEQLTPSTPSEESQLSLQAQRKTPDPNLLSRFYEHLEQPFIPSPRTTISLQDSPPPLGYSSPLLFDSPTTTTTTVDLSQFIHQVRMACAYHAYSSLRNSSVKLDGLQRKFRFLLSILSREDLTSYFEANLMAKVHPERMQQFEELPFFRVGGAGTHFLQSAPERYENHYPIREDPASDFSPDIQGELYGSWYDIRDLEGFLRDRDARLLTGPPTDLSSHPAAVNASNFIKSTVPIILV